MLAAVASARRHERPWPNPPTFEDRAARIQSRFLACHSPSGAHDPGRGSVVAIPHDMQPKLQADHPLRVLIHFAAHPGRGLVDASDVAHAQRVSRHLLPGLGSRLARLGCAEVVRGRSGGLRLEEDPEQPAIGAVARRVEPDFDLSGCFDRDRSTRPDAQACGFEGALAKAREVVLRVLDGCTLADFARRGPAFAGPWSSSTRERSAMTEAAKPGARKCVRRKAVERA